MDLKATYKDINDIIFDEQNSEKIEKMREGYFESMGNFLGSYLEWSKENVIGAVNENGEFSDEDKAFFEEMITNCWIFGMDLYSTTRIIANSEIDFSKYSEPSPDKVSVYMEDEELKNECLSHYDLDPTIRFLVNNVFQVCLEKVEKIVDYPFRKVALFKYTLTVLIKNTFMICYLQFER